MEDAVALERFTAVHGEASIAAPVAAITAPPDIGAVGESDDQLPGRFAERSRGARAGDVRAELLGLHECGGVRSPPEMPVGKPR